MNGQTAAPPDFSLLPCNRPLFDFLPTKTLIEELRAKPSVGDLANQSMNPIVGRVNDCSADLAFGL